MSRGKVVVIGGGVSGLAAGCYAMMNDRPVLVLEQHSRPGGVLATWDRKGFLVDPGLQLLWGFRQGTATYDLYRELGILPQRSVTPVKTLQVLDERGEQRLDLASPLEDLEREMRRLSPQDAEVIEDLIDAATCIEAETLLDQRTSRPADMSGALSGLSFFWKVRKFHRYLSGSWNHSLGQFTSKFRNAFLRRSIASLLPEESPAWLAAVGLSLSSSGGLGWLEEGSDGLISALCARLGRLGGRLELNARVDKVLVAGRKVTGVRLGDGRSEGADAVVSAADGNETVFKMLDGRFVDGETSRRYHDWRPSRPFLGVAIGTSAPLQASEPLRTVLLDAPLAIGTSSALSMVIRHFPQGTYFMPVGKDLLHVHLESDWNYWYKLRALDRRMYEQEKSRIGREVLARLEGLFPGIGGQVEMLDVSTPFTTWERTLNHEGSGRGWSVSRSTIKAKPMRTLPGLAGFYMAGQWVEPFGSVPTSLMSGKHAIQRICRDEGEAFKATAPAL